MGQMFGTYCVGEPLKNTSGTSQEQADPQVIQLSWGERLGF